jgi:hypothetical protein
MTSLASGSFPDLQRGSLHKNSLHAGVKSRVKRNYSENRKVEKAIILAQPSRSKYFLVDSQWLAAFQRCSTSSKPEVKLELQNGKFSYSS